MTSSMIIDAIRSVGQKGVQALDEALPVSPATPVPDADAVARFQAAMGPQDVSNTQKIEGVPFAQQISETWRVAQDNHQGLLHRIKALTELNGEHALSMAELSELQYNVATLSFQQEVVSKVADKASNAVQTLIKNQ